MKYWKGMTDDEREEVKLHLKKNNLDLDVTDAAVTDLSVFTYKVKPNMFKKLLSILF